MQWGALILAIAGCYATGVSYYLHRRTQRLKFLGLLFASALFVCTQIAQLLTAFFTDAIGSFIMGQIVEWGSVYCIALVLGALLLFIRESKPEFSRFPKFYAALPLVVVISYLLAYDTLVIKGWLMNIYQAGAAVVAMLIYGYYAYKDSIFYTLAIGMGLFLITYILSIALPSDLHIIWQIPFAIGIGTAFSGYLVVNNSLKEKAGSAA